MSTTTRKPYLTDLTDEQWTIFEPLIPPAKHGGRLCEMNMREALSILFYLNRAGCAIPLPPGRMSKTAYFPRKLYG